MNSEVLSKWKQFVGEEETKAEESQQSTKEQSEDIQNSDDDDDLNVGDEDYSIQKVYSWYEIPKEFYLNYIELKKAFVKRVFTKNPTWLAKNIETEINGLAGQIVRCNFELLMLIGIAPEDIREFYRSKFCSRIKERVEDSVFRSYSQYNYYKINNWI